MTADDKWGHTYIDEAGESILRDLGDWRVCFYFRDNDGWSFMRQGNQRRICFELAPSADFNSANEALKNYKKNLSMSKPSEYQGQVLNGLEKMIKERQKSLEIYAVE